MPPFPPPNPSHSPCCSGRGVLLPPEPKCGDGAVFLNLFRLQVALDTFVALSENASFRNQNSWKR